MTGDAQDMLARLKSVLPAGWFADATPVLDALLGGPAWVWSGLYSLLGVVRLQTRLASAAGVFLDLASVDYFGARLPRRVAEPDGAFSRRICAQLVAPRATRAGLAQALLNETGRAPVIFEPLNATDTGGYNSQTLGYGVAGGYGSLNLPFQFFVRAFRPNSGPIAHAGGYGLGPGGYGAAPMQFAGVADNAGVVSDADIYAAAAAMLPAAVTAWMNISD